MAKIKKKESENLSNNNIERVIALLNPSADSGNKPATKKDCCAILNISYNTVRLANIIKEYEERKEYTTRMRAERRGKKATEIEIQQVISEYLEGEPVSKIASGLFRSSGFVNAIIERVGVPNRPSAEERKGFAFLPESCVRELFNGGEVVWSAKYHAPAIVLEEIKEDKYQDRYLSKCYRISVIESVDSSESYFKHIESGGFNAFALAYDLGSLAHLEEYGVALDKI